MATGDGHLLIDIPAGFFTRVVLPASGGAAVPTGAGTADPSESSATADPSVSVAAASLPVGTGSADTPDAQAERTCDD